jgi:plasmid stabilization system protein ParE
MELLWTAPAIRDRQWIFDFGCIRSPAAASALDARIAARVTELAMHPRMGRRGRVAGTRELVVDDRYVLVYEATPVAVTILRVLHNRQHWPAYPSG